MKKIFTDIKTALYSVFPLLLCFGLAYLVGAFISWSMNPGAWSFDMRFCITIFALCLGFSIDNRFEYERNKKKESEKISQT